MGANKQNSKGGGYVGGLLQLFDWNAKSRKKLFSSKSELPEQSKQKKRCDGNVPVTRLHLMNEDEILVAPSIKGSDYSCASSVTDDELCGPKAPGVVARLMGLESMPMSNFSEPYSTPFLDSHSVHSTCHSATMDYHPPQLVYSGNLHGKIEAPVKNLIELKHQKVVTRPIEKFQTEVLPPKSAKSIPITHHKLLSPIKSANFVPSKSVDLIMEAAAKIIESGPQSTTKPKIPLVGSSSVPLKLRDLKEKIEASQKSSSLAETSRNLVEPTAAKHHKGQSRQPLHRSWNGLPDSTAGTRVTSDSEEYSSGFRNRGKSISLALQAKANVQKREGLRPSSNKSLAAQKEPGEVIISSQSLKSQPSAQKNVQKKQSASSCSTVLRQNNQKQNCLADKGKSPVKPSASNTQVRKAPGNDSSNARQKSSSKIGGNSAMSSRRLVSAQMDEQKVDQSSSTKAIISKKRSIDGNFHSERTQASENLFTDKIGASIGKGPMNCKENWAEDSKTSGTDVVSFTFTAPMIRSTPSPEISTGATKQHKFSGSDHRVKRTLLSSDGMRHTNFSFMGNNTLGGDALSTLLELKLKELTLSLEASCLRAETAKSSMPTVPESMPGLNIASENMFDGSRSWSGIHDRDLVCQCSADHDCSHHEGFSLRRRKHQDELGGLGRSNSETKHVLDYRLPSPISVLEPSIFAESCNSSDTADYGSTGGGKQSSSVRAQELVSMSPPNKLHSDASEAELLDSASSTSSSTVARQQVTILSQKDLSISKLWELEYVKQILSNIELMSEDFAAGRAREILNPYLFEQLESRQTAFRTYGHIPKLRRKVLFDCVGESLDLKFRSYAASGHQMWAKGLSIVRRKDRLAQEIYKEITEWSAMGDCMVDELVDKDMSNRCGKWLNFEIEAFELGVQLENRLLNSLIDEVVTDILVL